MLPVFVFTTVFVVTLSVVSIPVGAYSGKEINEVTNSWQSLKKYYNSFQKKKNEDLGLTQKELKDIDSLINKLQNGGLNKRGTEKLKNEMKTVQEKVEKYVKDNPNTGEPKAVLNESIKILNILDK